MRMHLAFQIDIYLQCFLHALKQLLFLIIGILALNACWSGPTHNRGLDPRPQRPDGALGKTPRPQTVLLYGQGKQQSMKCHMGAPKGSTHRGNQSRLGDALLQVGQGFFDLVDED